MTYDSFSFQLHIVPVMMLKFVLLDARNKYKNLKLEVLFQGLINHFIITPQLKCN